jgi:PIN domain nuclease of toxin-antitoxin system
MLLLDTHALLWLDTGAPMSPQSIAAIDDAAAAGEVLVSPVSAWEIGLLVARVRIRLDLDPVAWIARFLRLPGVRLAPLSPEAAVRSSFLPGIPHGDPADRLLIATARTLPAVLVTRDARILSYAADGHLQALAC